MLALFGLVIHLLLWLRPFGLCWLVDLDLVMVYAKIFGGPDERVLIFRTCRAGI